MLPRRRRRTRTVRGGVLARRATTYEDFLARQGLVMVLVAGDCRNMIGGSTI
jgi:hypothetical protein